MASLRTITEALDRAEKRIIVRARKALKPIRESIIEDLRTGQFEIYDVSEIAEAFKIGMLSAYIFGRASIAGDIQKKTKTSLKFAESSDYWEKLIEFIIKTDKSIMARLIRKKNDSEYYFRPSEEAHNFLSGYTVQLAHVIQKDLLKDITQWVQNTIQQGMGEREAIKYLQQKAVQFSKRRIQMIARTEATRAFNIGAIEESLSSSIVVGYRFSAVLDKNTSAICRARDGKFIPKSDTQLLISNTPPLHVNCRSRLEPVTQFDELPEKVMPNEWTKEETPKQRQYDLMVLERIIKSF